MKASLVALANASCLCVHLYTTMSVPVKKHRYVRIISISSCSAIAKLRASSHSLNIQRLCMGRLSVDASERWCPDCNPLVVETKEHALLDCPSHLDLRCLFRDKLAEVREVSVVDIEGISRDDMMATLVLPSALDAPVVGPYLSRLFWRVDSRYVISL